MTLSTEAAREARLEIRTNLAAAPVGGDPVLLERLVQNLLDNAVRYNAAERGWVSITTGTDGGHACLAVENTGPIVPSYDLDGLLEPFRRLASSDRLAAASGGAGLGLSIVRSVAHAHQGQIHLQPRPDGGLLVQVRIAALARPGRLPTADDAS